MKAFEIREFGIDNLTLTEMETPKPGAGEVLVKLQAASLNYRDLMMIKGLYNPRLSRPRVPLSDGAGEIVELGANCERFRVGDRVSPIFMQGWFDGEINHKKARTALGGDLDGVLREYGVFSEEGLVPIPESLSFEKAATLPCAGVTAWNALIESGKLCKGESVLTLGTGGVSIFALQFASAKGAEVFTISSSDDKLSRAIALGSSKTVNYSRDADWDKEILSLTENRGVDHVVEVGGAGTLQRSMVSTRLGGHIAVIGVLAGKGEIDPVVILMKSLKLQGVFVGSRKMFEDMIEFIVAHEIDPVIDSVFDFGDAIAALKYMESGAHFGKIVIKF